MVVDMKFSDDREYADVETGEVLQIPAGSKLVSPDRVAQMAKYAQQSNQTFKEKNKAYSNTLSIRGNFFTVLCRKTEVLWGNLSEPTIGKLIFLGTFIDKNNCLCFDGGWETEGEGRNRSFTRQSNPMTKSDIKKLLGVSDRTFYQFWNECVEAKALLETDDGIFLSKKMVRFCDSSHINKSKVRMIKVFKHAIRYMYENTDERSKKSLTNLYRLIPFINLKYNVLCENPFEMDKENIHPLTAADICEKLGLERKFHERVVKALKKLSFVDKQGDLRSVITYQWDMKNKEERYWIKINPQFYSGYISDEDMVKMIDEFLYDESEIDMYDL